MADITAHSLLEETMRTALKGLLLTATFIVVFAGTVGILGAREIAYQYNHNGHSLNPLKYTLTVPEKFRLSHPFWRGRWSVRQT
jgi:hypothetical protein